MGFLNPTKEEKHQIFQREESKRLEKKRDAQKRAEESKKKRDAEKARIAEIEANVETKKPRRLLTRVDHINEYLDAPPFMGTSEKRDYQQVKRLCGSEQKESVFDGSTKRWGTKDINNIKPLVDSGLWYPYGLNEEWESELQQALRERTAKPVAAAAAAPDVVGERRRRDALLGVLPTTQEELEQCATLGVSDLVDASSMCNTLGPRNGLSNAARLLRWVSLNTQGGESQAEVLRDLRKMI